MTRTRHSLTILFACAAGLSLGCADATKPRPDDKSHDYKPKFGKELKHLADHGPIVELTHDEAGGVVKLWVFGPHHAAKPITKPPVLNVPGQPPKQLTAAGSGAEWTFTDALLKSHVHGLALRIEIDGKTFNKDWDPGH
ncbi:MAG: hypothetical protein KDC87_14935 [Planctomycetes bacterium]|nr:hypothetical protein [Planctomycetota bacterium]MCB9868585.1 hypothetical protein [Planctomycetota bacterium]